MAKCSICEKEMNRAKGCAEHVYIMNDGTKTEPIPVMEYQVHENGRCVDCAAKVGEYHHPGCDQEACSICGLQVIGCDCDYSDELEVTHYVRNSR
jgi:hypothetical protein